MKAEYESELTKTTDGDNATTVCLHLFLGQVASDVFHSLHVFRKLLIVGIAPVSYPFYLQLALPLEIRDTRHTVKSFIHNIRLLDQWR